MDAWYRTACTSEPTSASTCPYCLDDGTGASTGTCISTCDEATVNSAGCATLCHENCKSCFGDSANECFACELTSPTTLAAIDQTYIASDTSCPSCGDSIRTSPLETCDDGNVIDGDGCSADCLIIENYYVCSDESATGGPDICTIDPSIDPDGIAL